jgi:hypothetical protein
MVSGKLSQHRFARGSCRVRQESEFNLEAVEQELRQEAVSRNATIPSPTMVGCFARKA